MAPDWSSYVGLPYRLGARGPDAYDCWGLVRLILEREWGVSVPCCADATPEDASDRVAMARAIEAADKTDWVRVAGRERRSQPLTFASAERPGDVVLMRVGSLPCHVGIVIAPDRMLHTEAGTGAVLARLRQGVKAASIVALFRHRALCRVAP